MIDSPYGGRKVKEWIGKTPDSRPPQAVRVRVFDRFKGVCHITGRKIGVKDKWQCDHVKRLADGGENRERNLAPALQESDAHVAKTAKENSEGAKATRARAKHIGAEDEPKKKIAQRPREEKPPPRPVASGVSEIARRYGIK